MEAVPLPAFVRFFDLPDERRVPPHEGVVGEPADRPAFAVELEGGAVGRAQSFLCFGSSFGTAGARDAAGRGRSLRPRDRPPAMRRILERPARGFVVDVHQTMLAISKGDGGGGQRQTHPLDQFFADSSSSAKEPTAA